MYFSTLLASYAYSTSLPTIKEQEDLLDSITKKSCKLKKIADADDNDQYKTISRYLIDTIQINNNICDPDLKNKNRNRFIEIITSTHSKHHTTGESKNFWQKKFTEKYKMYDIFLGGGNRESNLYFHNSPRQQQFILNSRELLRFRSKFNQYNQKNPTTPMICHSNFATDDVIKAMSLSGTFCLYERGMLEPSFSSMLLPNQPYGINFVDGVDINSENCFAVKYVKEKINTREVISQMALDNMNQDRAYDTHDYAVAIIEGRSASNKKRSLRRVFQDRQETNILNEKNYFQIFP